MEPKQEAFSVVKQKIIKTDEILQMYVESNSKLKKTAQCLNDLKFKFDRSQLENERCVFNFNSLKSKHEQLEKQYEELSFQKNDLEKKYSFNLISSHNHIRTLEDELKMLTELQNAIKTSSPKQNKIDPKKYEELEQKLAEYRDTEIEQKRELDKLLKENMDLKVEVDMCNVEKNKAVHKMQEEKTSALQDLQKLQLQLDTNMKLHEQMWHQKENEVKDLKLSLTNINNLHRHIKYLENINKQLKIDNINKEKSFMIKKTSTVFTQTEDMLSEENNPDVESLLKEMIDFPIMLSPMRSASPELLNNIPDVADHIESIQEIPEINVTKQTQTKEIKKPLKIPVLKVLKRNLKKRLPIKRKFVPRVQDSILRTLQILKKSNINFTISNDSSIPQHLNLLKDYCNVTTPQIESLTCKSNSCKNMNMLLNKSVNNNSLLGFFNDKNENVAPSNNESIITPENILDKLAELVTEKIKNKRNLRETNLGYVSEIERDPFETPSNEMFEVNALIMKQLREGLIAGNKNVIGSEVSSEISLPSSINNLSQMSSVTETSKLYYSGSDVVCKNYPTTDSITEMNKDIHLNNTDVMITDNVHYNPQFCNNEGNVTNKDQIPLIESKISTDNSVDKKITVLNLEIFKNFVKQNSATMNKEETSISANKNLNTEEILRDKKVHSSAETADFINDLKNEDINDLKEDTEHVLRYKKIIADKVSALQTSSKWLEETSHSNIRYPENIINVNKDFMTCMSPTTLNSSTPNSESMTVNVANQHSPSSSRNLNNYSTSGIVKFFKTPLLLSPIGTSSVEDYQEELTTKNYDKKYQFINGSTSDSELVIDESLEEETSGNHNNKNSNLKDQKLKQESIEKKIGSNFLYTPQENISNKYEEIPVIESKISTDISKNLEDTFKRKMGSSISSELSENDVSIQKIEHNYCKRKTQYNNSILSSNNEINKNNTERNKNSYSDVLEDQTEEIINSNLQHITYNSFKRNTRSNSLKLSESNCSFHEINECNEIKINKYYLDDNSNTSDSGVLDKEPIIPRKIVKRHKKKQQSEETDSDNDSLPHEHLFLSDSSDNNSSTINQTESNPKQSVPVKRGKGRPMKYPKVDKECGDEDNDKSKRKTTKKITKLQSKIMRQMKEKHKMLQKQPNNDILKDADCDVRFKVTNKIHNENINIEKNSCKSIQQPKRNVRSSKKINEVEDKGDILLKIMEDMDKIKPQKKAESAVIQRDIPDGINEKEWRRKILDIAEITHCSKNNEIMEIYGPHPYKKRPTGILVKDAKVPEKVTFLLDKLLKIPNEDDIPEIIMREFKRLTTHEIIEIVIYQVSRDIHDKPDIKYYPAPLMTRTQRIFLGLLIRLEKEKGFVNIIDEFFFKTQQYIFKIGCSFRAANPLTRLFLCLCRLHGNINRMRTFCCEAFFNTKNLAIPIFFIVLTSWTEVIPLEVDIKTYPLAKVLVQLVHLKTLLAPGQNLFPLKCLLSQYYGYPKERWNCDQLFDELCQEYLVSPSMTSDYAIRLFCRNKESKWVYQKLNQFFKPLIYKIPSENINFKASTIILMGKICRQFRPSNKHDIKCLVELKRWFIGLLEGDPADLIKQSINLSLEHLPSKLRKATDRYFEAKLTPYVNEST